MCREKQRREDRVTSGSVVHKEMVSVSGVGLYPRRIPESAFDGEEPGVSLSGVSEEEDKGKVRLAPHPRETLNAYFEGRLLANSPDRFLPSGHLTPGGEGLSEERNSTNCQVDGLRSSLTGWHDRCPRGRPQQAQSTECMRIRKIRRLLRVLHILPWSHVRRCHYNFLPVCG